MKWVSEQLGLMKTAWKATLYSMREERKVKKIYSIHKSFQRCDQDLRRQWRWTNPYAVCRRFLASQGAVDVYTYGETPLSTLERIAHEIPLGKDDRFLDLGCGRGRGVFFLHARFGCQAIGVDWVPAFIEKARSVAQSMACPVEFELANMVESESIREATVIYLAWTCIEHEERIRIDQSLNQAQSGAKIVTISYPLLSKNFNLYATSTASFPWGEAEVFFHIRR